MYPPKDFLRVVIDPGCRILDEITGLEMGTQEAKVLLLAIALQESGLEHRRQLDSAGNPIDTLARGWWQFEAGGGVAGVCNHSASQPYAQAVCAKFYIPFAVDDIHEAMAWNGYLAMVWARLLLLTDPKPLPAIGQQEAAWDYYLRNWRPGKPRPDTWPQNYSLAVNTVAAAVLTPPAPFIQPNKPGTLTSKVQDGTFQVDLPKMNRSWTTGSFWMALGSGVMSALILLGPLLEPALDRAGNSEWLAAIPLGLGPVLYAVAREWYRAQRVKYAAEVAAAQAKRS